MNPTAFQNRQLAIMFILMVLGVAAFWPTVVSAGGVAKETFPRLGGTQIGSHPYAGWGDPNYHRDMAKLDYVVLGLNDKAMNNYARSIREMNPNILLAKYTKLIEVYHKKPGYSAEIKAKLSAEEGPNASNAHDWFARDFDGNNVSNWLSNWTANFTDYVKPDANGDRFPQWLAKQNYEWWFQHDVWDVVYEDAVHWKPRPPASGAEVDWSGGQETNRLRLEAAYRNGHKNYWDEIKRLAPEKLIVANHDWYRYEMKHGVWDLEEYDQQIHGGLLEMIMKETDTDPGSTRMSWEKARISYYKSMKYFKDPKLVMFVVQGEPDNYQFFRYAFATCLLNGGYFDYAPNEYYFGTVEWFDEFDLAGQGDTDWLGRAVETPPTSSWQNGVWRRDFEGGVALVNPAGNGSVTVTIESGFRRMNGQQAPSVNNGKAANTIDLKDGDGIILVRDATVTLVADPKPPSLSVN